METLYIGQRVTAQGEKGLVTGLNKDGSYTVILDNGAILRDQPRANLQPGESNLHNELKETLALLAHLRAAESAADRKYQDEFEAWQEQNADLIKARQDSKELSGAVDQAARAIVSRIFAEQGDKTPHPHASVAERPTPKLLVEESVAVKWAIENKRIDALKLNTSQMNTLIKAGVAPDDIGKVISNPVVNIDTDLSDLLTSVPAALPPSAEPTATEEAPF